jgi:hypothetical protein
VTPAELIFFVVLIVLLLLLAGYFGWKQLQTLRGLRRPSSETAEDRRFLHRQAIRRLVCCALMLLLAGLLIGNLFLDSSYREMMDERKRDLERGVEASQEHKDFARFFTAYWAATLFVLFTLITLAGFDFWAIARFGLRQRRQLQADHRAILHEELARFRRQRNGESEH